MSRVCSTRTRFRQLIESPNLLSCDPSLKTVLHESQVAVVAIGILLSYGVLTLFQLIWVPARESLDIFIDAIRYPYVLHRFRDILNVQFICTLLFAALPYFAVAWILSIWIFRAGPFEAVIAYLATLRRKHAQKAATDIGG